MIVEISSFICTSGSSELGPCTSCQGYLKFVCNSPVFLWKLPLSCVSFHGLKKLLTTEVVVMGTAICQSNEGMWQREHLIMKNLVLYRRGSVALKTHRFIWAYCPRTRSSRRRNWIWGQIKTTAGITYNFFGFNTSRSAKAYYFRLNYDQWAVVGFRLFKTKAPSFLPAGLQKGKKSKLSKVKQNGDIRREGEQTSIVLHLFSMIKTWMFQFSVESPCAITFFSWIHVLLLPWVCFLRSFFCRFFRAVQG